MKRFIFSALLFLLPTLAHAQTWTVAPASCGSNPSGTVTQGSFANGVWLVSIRGTAGTGTVTSCVLNFNTDGQVAFNAAAAPSCLAMDQTSGVVMLPAFSATGNGAWSYGSVTLTEPGSANFGGHTIPMWCSR